MILYQLTYISKKSKDCTDREINEILASSQKNNSKDKITGILIEYKKHFLQYLEGDPIVVYELFEKIKKDKRHEGIFLAKFDKIETRNFERWTMVYRNLDRPEESKFVSKSDVPQKMEDVLNKHEFWKTIDVIEFMSNLK